MPVLKYWNYFRVHFPTLNDLALQKEIAEVGQLMHFTPGQVIMNYGSYIKLVPLLVKGSIKVLREDDMEGRELLLYYLNKEKPVLCPFPAV